MTKEAIDIRKYIRDCHRIIDKMNFLIKQNNINFTDHDALEIGFVLDEFRLSLDNFQNEIDDRITVEVMEKLI